MEASIQSILKLAEDARSTAEATLLGLNVNQLTWSPSADRWSAAKIADHLVLSNSALIPKFRAAIAEAPVQRGVVYRYNFLERKILDTMRGDGIKVPVPPAFEPKSPVDPKATVDLFLETHDELVAILRSAQERDLSGVRVTSPVSALVKLRCVAYLQALIEHERYHLGQVVALIEEPGFPR